MFKVALVFVQDVGVGTQDSQGKDDLVIKGEQVVLGQHLEKGQVNRIKLGDAVRAAGITRNLHQCLCCCWNRREDSILAKAMNGSLEAVFLRRI